MAQVNFTIPDDKIAFFVEAFEQDYDQLIESGQGEAGQPLEGVSKSQYAKNNALTFLASRVRKFHKQKELDNIVEIDITE